MSRTRAAAALACALAVAAAEAADAAGQEWRTINARRQLAGEDELRVELDYTVGRVRIAPGEAGSLYRASIRYDAELFDPIHAYSDRHLRIGVSDLRRVRTSRRDRFGDLELALGPEVPVHLEVMLGAAEAELELGGLRLTRVEVSGGASDSRVRFSEPNRARMDRLVLKTGATRMHVFGLGNANAEQVEIDGGVGELVVDFTGELREAMTVDVNLGIGSLLLQLPRGLGVEVVRTASFLMPFDSEGLIKRGDAFYSENWEQAAHRLTIRINGAIGSVRVRWLEENKVS